MSEQNKHLDKKDAARFKGTLHDIVKRLHELARREQEIMKRLDALDRTAAELGDIELGITLRKSFTKIVDCGRLLTQAHIDLTIPATVIQRLEHEGK